VNHVAVMTEDLDRFVDFYSDVFDLDLVFTEDTPAFRHAILRPGERSWLHPAEVVDGVHGAASSSMFDRGHLDHLALTAVDQEAFTSACKRLVARGASDGSVDDLGAFHSVWFTDPDGMQVELVLVVDDALGGIHEPRPLERA
jgi:catechol 2,3-dioxygenase-like lactoylglutathione lyase family enzyme